MTGIALIAFVAAMLVGSVFHVRGMVNRERRLRELRRAVRDSGQQPPRIAKGEG